MRFVLIIGLAFLKEGRSNFFMFDSPIIDYTLNIVAYCTDKRRLAIIPTKCLN